MYLMRKSPSNNNQVEPYEIEMNKSKKQQKQQESINLDSSYQSPIHKHNCTDIICLLLFIIFIIALIALSVFAYLNGQPSQLILPHDTYGNICGQNELSEKPYLLFHDFTRCISLSALSSCSTPQVCVKQCPTRNLFYKIPSHKNELEQYLFKNKLGERIVPVYVLESRPLLKRCVPILITQTLDLTQNIFAFDSSTQSNVSISIASNSSETTTSSLLTLNKLKQGVEYLSKILNYSSFFEYVYEDFIQAKWFIVLAICTSIVLSFLWILLLRFIFKPLFYTSILLIIGLLSYSLYFCINEYLLLKSTNKGTYFKLDDLTLEKALDLNYIRNLIDTWLALSIITGILLGILTLVLLFLRKRIKLAIELIRESSKTIVAIPSSLVWPLVPFLLQLSTIVYLITIGVYLASSGKSLYKIIQKDFYNLFTTNVSIELVVDDLCDVNEFYLKYNNTKYDCVFFKFGYNSTYPFEYGNLYVQEYYSVFIRYLDSYQLLPQIFLIFMFYWLSSFTLGFNQMTLSGAFSSWYWTRYSNIDSKLKNKLPWFPLLGSCKRALFNHAGTLAFGSLIISIVNLIRVTLEYANGKLKKSILKNNQIAKCLMTCLKCFFWCLDKFIKFVNRNAYIVCSIYGYNFCKSARTGFTLVFRNCLRVTVVDGVTEFLLFLSKLSVTITIGIGSFYAFTIRNSLVPELNYYFVPLIIILIGSYLVAKLFSISSQCV